MIKFKSLVLQTTQKTRVSQVKPFFVSNVARSFHQVASCAHQDEDHTTSETNSNSAIRFITIDNPTKRNALSYQVLENLVSQLKSLSLQQSSDTENRPKVVILQSHGPVFSSGHDLKELKQNSNDAQFGARTIELCTEMMQLIRAIDQPVIAKVQGLATAAGCQIVAACDLAVAADTAQFATPGVKIGLFCTTPGVALARAVSRKKAMEMLLTGKPITAQEALQHGLINKVVPADQLDSEALEMAKHIASASFETIALGKKAFYEQIEMNTADAYQFGCKVMIDNLSMDDCIEGIDAFTSKRKPVWKH